MEQFGSSVGARRRALYIKQASLGLAIGRSQTWISQLECLRIVASEADKARIEAFLQEHEAPLAIPATLPRKVKRAR